MDTPYNYPSHSRGELEYVDSWVDLAYSRCFQLMRADGRSLFRQWVSARSDLAEFDIVPVRTSREAAEAIAPEL